MMARKALIIFAHEEKKSLNATLKKLIANKLKRLGYEVKISDLYAQNFDPVMRRKDLKDVTEDIEHLNYSTEAGKCFKQKTLAPYIMEEAEKVAWADLLIFQFPVCWYAMPAILKGWIDKILIDDFAFSFKTGSVLENGLLKGKRAMLSITTGALESMFSIKGIAGDLNVHLWPIQYSLRICGVEIMKPFCVHDAINMNGTIIKSVEEKLEERLAGIFEEKPLKFLPLQSYTFPPGELSDTFVAQVEDEAPTVGQHMGKPITNNSTD